MPRNRNLSDYSATSRWIHNSSVIVIVLGSSLGTLATHCGSSRELELMQHETLEFLVRTNIKYSQSARSGHAILYHAMPLCGFIWEYSRARIVPRRTALLSCRTRTCTHIRIYIGVRVCIRARSRAAADTAQCYLKFRPFIFHRRDRRYRSRKYWRSPSVYRAKLAHTAGYFRKYLKDHPGG